MLSTGLKYTGQQLYFPTEIKSMFVKIRSTEVLSYQTPECVAATLDSPLFCFTVKPRSCSCKLSVSDPSGGSIINF